MSILDDHPERQAHQQKVTDLVERETARREHLAAMTGPYWVRLEAWKAERDEAYRTGNEPPPPPEEPDVSAFDGAARVFAQEREELREEDKVVLARILPEIEEQARARSRARREKARKLTREVLALLGEENADLEDVRRCRRAADTLDPNERPSPGSGLADRTRNSLGVAEFFALVQSDEDPLAIRPMTRPSEQQPMIVLSEPETVKGLTPPNPFGKRPPDLPRQQQRRFGEI